MLQVACRGTGEHEIANGGVEDVSCALKCFVCCDTAPGVRLQGDAGALPKTAAVPSADQKPSHQGIRGREVCVSQHANKLANMKQKIRARCWPPCESNPPSRRGLGLGTDFALCLAICILPGSSRKVRCKVDGSGVYQAYYRMLLYVLGGMRRASAFFVNARSAAPSVRHAA